MPPKAKAKARPRIRAPAPEQDTEPERPQVRVKPRAIARPRIKIQARVDPPKPKPKAKPVAKPKARPVSKTVPQISAQAAQWVHHGSCCIYVPEKDGAWDTRLALFDLDGTLLSVGGMDPVDEGLSMLHKYLDEGWTVGVISNQYGVSKGKTDHEQVRNRFELLTEYIPGPIVFVYATAKDQYRKPMPGMYRLFLDELGFGPGSVRPESFYCGDAAGRAKDFAVSDRYFAHNSGLDFLPASPFTALVPVAKKYDLYADERKWKRVHVLSDDNLDLPDKVVVLMVGPPGSGKSTLSTLLSTRYPSMVVLNRDTIGNTKKMNRMYADAVRTGKSIILDNLNTDQAKRAEYLDGFDLDAAGYTVVCYHFDIAKELSTHLCHMRVGQGGRYIPPVVRHTYYKRMEAPTEAEPGIDRVIILAGLPLLDGQEPPDEFNMCYNLKER